MGHHWISKEEEGYRELRPRLSRTRQTVDDWIDQSSFPVYAEDWRPALAPTPVGE
jgi:hypothetical protein